MDDKTKKLLAEIHNTLLTMHPTGQDIITAASIAVEIRKALEEKGKEEEETNE